MEMALEEAATAADADEVPIGCEAWRGKTLACRARHGDDVFTHPLCEDTMPITASCSACNSAFRVGDEYAGKRVKCPKCGEAMTVPGVGEWQGLAAGPPPGPA